MRTITASATARLLECRYPLRPDVELPPEQPDAQRDEGTAVHRAIHEDSQGGALAVVARRPDGSEITEQRLSTDPRAVAARAWIAATYGGRPLTHEAAYGWREGIRAWYVGVGRESYALAPMARVLGTADLVVSLGHGRWTVVEWKTGERGSLDAEAQLRTLGSLVLLATGGTEIHLCAAYLPENGPVEEFYYGCLEPLDARLHLASLTAPRDLDPHPGEHCTRHYCPLVGRCPAYVEAAAQASELVPAMSLVPRARNPLVEGVKSDEDAAAVVLAIPLIEARLEVLREEARARAIAAGGKLPLSDGRTYAQTYVRKTSLSAKKLAELAEKLGATPEQLGECNSDGSHFAWRILGKAGGARPKSSKKKEQAA
jgi:hypothetical protein